MMDGMKDNPKSNKAPTFSKRANIAHTFSKWGYNNKAEDKSSFSRTQSRANPQALNLESSTLPLSHCPPMCEHNNTGVNLRIYREISITGPCSNRGPFPNLDAKNADFFKQISPKIEPLIRPTHEY